MRYTREITFNVNHREKEKKNSWFILLLKLTKKVKCESKVAIELKKKYFEIMVEPIYMTQSTKLFY